jgi:uncharacterized protein involved in exopolysaccharide biosynthesis
MNAAAERAQEAGTPARPGSGELLNDAALLLIRNARLILGVALLVTVAATAALMLLDRAYAAHSTIAPEVSETAMPLGGLAAQFGITLPGGGSEQSVDFYARLVKSRQLLEAVGTSTFRFAETEGGEEREGTLLELYGIEAESQRARIQKLVNRLNQDVQVSTDVRANLVEVSTRAPWPLLAEAVNRRLLELMSEFNLEHRQSTAEAERRFIEARVAEAQEELAAAEGRLRQFHEQNRRLGGSPQLELEAQQLQRAVDLRQEVYTTLAQSYERVRIDEVRNTPVFTVLDPPERSARPTRGLLTTLIVALILGVAAGVAVAVGREAVRRARRDRPAWYEALRSPGRSDQPGRDGVVS